MNVPQKGREIHQLARDFLAKHLGKGPTDDPGSRKFHSLIMGKLAGAGGDVSKRTMGLSTPGAISGAGAALLAGLENELVGGAGEALQGRDFASEAGFDVEDLLANLKGVEGGVGEAMADDAETAGGLAQALRKLLGGGPPAPPAAPPPAPGYAETRQPGDGVPPEVVPFLKSRGRQ